MKQKLQIVQPLVDTYSFAFRNFPTMLRLGWVGYVLVVALLGLFVWWVAAGTDWSLIFLGDDEYGNTQEGVALLGLMTKVYGGLFIVMIASWLLLAPFGVIVRQLAAGTVEAPAGFGYFRFGGRELRYVAACFILFVLGIVVAILAAIPFVLVLAFVVSGGGGSAPQGGELGLIFLAYVVYFVLICWFSLRACLFTTVAAIENDAAPFGAFGLTGGNVWRLLAAWILYILSIMAMEMVLQFLFFFVGMAGFGIFAPLFDGGEISMSAAVSFGIVCALIISAYGFVRVTLDAVFPARLYVSLRRPTEEELIAALDDTPPLQEGEEGAGEDGQDSKAEAEKI